MGRPLHHGSKRNRGPRYQIEAVVPDTERDRRRLAFTSKNPKRRAKSEQKDSYLLGKFGAASGVRRIDPKTGEPFKE